MLKDEWIKCSERLPENRNDVLIYMRNGIVVIDSITNPKDGNLWSGIYIEDAYAWQPLPLPPKKEKENVDS